MRKIQDLMQEIRNLSQEMEQFYEVELSLLIRTHGGEQSQFIRLQTEKEPNDHLENNDRYQFNGPDWF
ncbi:hypothetical protein [Methylophaga sp.]|uniref:hypothetical protein n=1 Tax=Methylophaga sp. TaxID=2024840 RepID=UPI003A946897